MIEYIIPENPEEVRKMMQKLGISEEMFTAEEFYFYYDARNWLAGGEKIRRWPSMLICWKNNHYRRFNAARKKGKSEAKKAPSAAYTPAEHPQQQVERDQEVMTWLECQYPMPEAEQEPEKRKELDHFFRVYSLANQHMFGQYEHLKEILTRQTITIGAAVQKFGQAMVERLLILHIDSLARYHATTLATFPLEQMQQAARWIIQKAPTLRISEFLLIIQNAHDNTTISTTNLCRGDIKLIVEAFPQWKRNTLQYLK